MTDSIFVCRCKTCGYEGPQSPLALQYKRVSDTEWRPTCPSCGAFAEVDVTDAYRVEMFVKSITEP